MSTRIREPQLAYSEIESRSLDEAKRRRKARKIIAVAEHFLGRSGLDGLRVLDVGCSAGFICDELAGAGAAVTGVDIDVPGLARAVGQFAGRARFACGDGGALPLPSGSVDLVVFNHIYEHVVDADLVVAEIRRVLADDGVVYLGLGNRLGIMEPHYRLPLLSYLPPAAADRYVQLSGRGEQYYERYRTRPGLRRMLAGTQVWDYTLPVVVEPARFAAAGEFPAALSRLPAGLLRVALPVVPTYVWVASPVPRRPAGAPLRVPPRQLRTPSDCPSGTGSSGVPRQERHSNRIVQLRDVHRKGREVGPRAEQAD